MNLDCLLIYEKETLSCIRHCCGDPVYLKMNYKSILFVGRGRLAPGTYHVTIETKLVSNS